MSYPAAYIYMTSPARFRPLMGGPDLLVGSLPGTYPPNYGSVGSYRPDATTTGPPSGTVMTAFNGNLTAATAGATYDSIEFFGKVSVAAANVTFNRCIFHGKAADPNGTIVTCTNANVVNAQFNDCILAPLPGMPAMNGINGHDFIMRRCEITNTVDALDPYNTNVADANSNIILEQCWLHDFAYYTPDAHQDNQTHNDAVQIQGIHSVTIRGCSIEAYYGTVGTFPYGGAADMAHSNTLNPTPAGWTNPDLTCILLNSSVSLGTTQLHTVTDNWLLGGFVPCNLSGAGAGVNLGTWQRNRFSGDSGRWSYAGITDFFTIWMRSDQTISAGEGDPVNQNTFMDGRPIYIMRNG